MNLRALYKHYVSELSHIYPDSEAQTLVMWIFEAYLSMSRKDVLNNTPINAIPEALEIAFTKLMAGEPIQYVLGKAPFYGRYFKVGPGVLIPRNETEELVQLITQNHKGPIKILDLGTGSGCIAITLALECPKAELTAIDVSEQALAIAKFNASELKAKLNLVQKDILAGDLQMGNFDLMVSNPPYVLEKERSLMQNNVLDHEPGLALFVPDSDPLRFYKAIVSHAKKNLNANGYLYFEINEAFGLEVMALMHLEGFSDVQLYQDINGKDRIVYGKKTT
ncbi:peptide chain release factor N(5)-glutamine methyltransferase [Cyclobacterium qasimii]|uniref:peptide chain release factor N(5)-glutamine methyltransferase n=2 Tax=Cyclobacterium qasimii TaxID=1350429 RepID=S7WPT3_9BACT|nr:peptide chain release factor N(5)-glutamine methyltransferase [Cyclobacterium qasimii]EPR66138.1 Protein-N(5)-glutamine methyltransferase PrmC, methylates polypeptide chain release factors RF1 and RF2 [Cyclobacterium qasimii M12-11B]GEO21246.1 release factor glutamine methyltransferase [Cyclobacterium qasimii]